MGKKKLRAKYTSKGIVGSNQSIANAVRRDRHPLQDVINKFAAFKSGKNVYFTIDNPNPNETAKRKIRVKARDIYGDPRTWFYGKRDLTKQS